jgi:hypothetical protein
MPVSGVMRLLVSLALLGATVLCVGCSISVHFGHGNPRAEDAYRKAISRPFQDLTAMASRANKVCAGGSQSNPRLCYTDTHAEIGSARAVERILATASIPPRFTEANSDLLHGLGIFVQGLVKRDDGLAIHSGSEYSTSYLLINKGLAEQKAALAEYPPGSNIAG